MICLKGLKTPSTDDVIGYVSRNNPTCPLMRPDRPRCDVVRVRAENNEPGRTRFYNVYAASVRFRSVPSSTLTGRRVVTVHWSRTFLSWSVRQDDRSRLGHWLEDRTPEIHVQIGNRPGFNHCIPQKKRGKGGGGGGGAGGLRGTHQLLRLVRGDLRGH